MQDKSNIDLKIKEKLGKTTAPMPDGLFESILNEIPAQTSERKARVWTPYLLLGLGILIFLFLLRTCKTDSTKLFSENNGKKKNSLTNVGGNSEEKTFFFDYTKSKEQRLSDSAKNTESRFVFDPTEINLYLNEQFYNYPNTNYGFLSIGEDNYISLHNRFSMPVANYLNQQETINRLPYKLSLLDANEKLSLNEFKTTPIERSKFSLRLFGGPTVNYRTLRVDTYKDLEQHRNSHETAYASFNVGAQLNFKVNHRFEFFAGLEYTEMGEKYAFEHNDIQHRTENTYSYFSIPIGIGYRLNHSNKFYSIVRAQVNTSINNGAQASWIDPNLLTPISHSDKGEHNPYRKITFSSRIAMELGISFNTLSIFMSPTINYTLTNIYKTKEVLNQHPFSGGINFGVRINL